MRKNKMSPRRLLFLVLVMLFLFLGDVWSLDAARDIIPAHQAREFINQQVTVEGKVTAARTDGRNTFLVIGPESQPEMTVALTPPLLLSKFPDNPEAFYPGKTVQIRGQVYLFKGKPEILVKHASFIKVVGEKKRKTHQEEEGAKEDNSDESFDPHTMSQVGLPLSPKPLLPHELAASRSSTVRDMRSSNLSAEGEGLATSASNACGEAQELWRQVSQDLIPHLRSYTSCLEKGSLGCDSEGEKVALGMLGVQQAQKRIRMVCQ